MDRKNLKVVDGGRTKEALRVAEELQALVNKGPQIVAAVVLSADDQIHVLTDCNDTVSTVGLLEQAKFILLTEEP